MTELENKLESLGFGKNETVVYLSLIEQGKAKAGVLIEQTKLHRNLVYTSLGLLQKKGLVTKTTKNGVAEFETTSPTALVDMVEMQKSIAEDVTELLKKRQREAPRDIRIFEGIEGVRCARERSLSLPPDETVYIIGASQRTATQKYEPMWLQYHRKRVQREINCKMLVDHTLPEGFLSGRNSIPRMEARYLPFPVQMPAFFEMFGDTFSIGIPSEEPVVLSVRSAEAVEGMKKFFDFLWNQRVVIEYGVDALRKALSHMLDQMNPGETYDVLGAYLTNDEHIREVYRSFHRQRIQKQIHVEMLAYTEQLDEVRTVVSADTGDALATIKPFISAPQNPMQIYLYHGKAFMCVMSSEPSIIYFDQPEIAQSFKAYFDHLWNQETYVLHGGDAVKRIWLEGIEAKEMRFIGARGFFVDRFPKLFQDVYEKAQDTTGIHWRNIADVGVKGHRVTTFPWMKTKYTISTTKNPNVVWLYGKKVAIVNWTEKEPVIFLSENKHLVQSYNDYFEELWKMDEVR